MEVEELEQRLKEDAGAVMVYSTDSENYVGSIWVSKRSIGPLTLADFTPDSELYKRILAKEFRGSLTLEDLSPESRLYKDILRTSKRSPKSYKGSVELRRDIEERWITVVVREVNREDYVGPDYFVEEEDYRKHDVNFFKSISELQEYLNSLGFSITDLIPFD
jgi:hypothetical protein